MGNKIKLVESFYKDWDNPCKPQKITLTESNKTITLRESKYDVLSAYKLPIWKLGKKNQNEREYPESLGEKVVKENKVTVALDTHPDDDYEPKLKDIIAVGKNPSIELTNEGKVLFAECYFVDEDLAKKVDRAVDLGYMFEQSSSGYGELDSKGVVVTESYELERYFDLLVSDSSYAVSFGEENRLVNSDNRPKQETTQKEFTNNSIDNKNSFTNLEEKEQIKEENNMDKQVTALDKVIKKSIVKGLKEAKTMTNPSQRLAELEEVSTYLDDVSDTEIVKELNEEIQSLVLETKKELETLAEKGQQLDNVLAEKEEVSSKQKELSENVETLQEQVVTLGEQLECSFQEMDTSKEVYESLKALYEDKLAESNSKIDCDDYVKLDAHCKELEEKIGEIEAKNKFLKERVAKIKENGMKLVRKPKRKREIQEQKVRRPIRSRRIEESNTEMLEARRAKFKEAQKARMEEAQKKEFTSTVKHKDLRIETQYDDIKEYYEDLRQIYGEAIESFKADFENCKTLVEAQQCYFRHKPYLTETRVPKADSRRNIIDRFQEETIKSKTKDLHGRTEIDIDNCRPEGFDI